MCKRILSRRALAVSRGDEVAAIINRLMQNKYFDLVVATQDEVYVCGLATDYCVKYSARCRPVARLVTGGNQSALGGVYKLSVVRDEGKMGTPRVKIFEQTIKISNPGVQQVRKFYEEKADGKMALSDVIYNQSTPIAGNCVAFDLLDVTKRWELDGSTLHQDLLVPIFRNGARAGELPNIHTSRDFARQNLAQFSNGVKRFVNPHLSRVGIEEQLSQTKTRLILETRQK